jgi:hypothetical protein
LLLQAAAAVSTATVCAEQTASARRPKESALVI